SNPEHMLILVWNNPPKSYRDQFSREIESDCIRFEGGINDETLRLLYTGASASFFSSRYEGFGLPVLESMACGTPVITCLNSALPEVGSNAALYIDPDDVRGMADIMEAFEKKTIDRRKDLSKKCLVQAQEFTWEKTARAYLNFYKKHLEN
ncbi:MAG: glycosyltransferase, partial [Prolixibacteraceae bacterium]